MLAKVLFFVTVINLLVDTSFEIPRKDVIILKTGERVEGHINSIVAGFVTISTKNGDITMVREGKDKARDIVETGVLKYKRQAGYIKYFGDYEMEIETSAGDLSIKRTLVRKIIISQDSTLPPLDL